MWPAMRVAASLMSSIVSIVLATETRRHRAKPTGLASNHFCPLCLCASVAVFHFKDFGEAYNDTIFDRAHFNFAAEQLLHRSYRLAFAGNNQIEIAEIGVYVQSEAVGRYPARDVHANRRDFAARGVHAGQARD